MKIQCFPCGAINSARARFCRKCGERLSERQPTSIRRITDEPEPVLQERQAGQSAAAAANVAAPLLMVVLLCVAFKAYASFVKHAPESYTAMIAVDAAIVALFVLPARHRIRAWIGFSPKWVFWAGLGGIAIALVGFAGNRFTHWLGMPLDPGLGVWFEQHGSSAFLGSVCGLVFIPLIYEVGLRGYFQGELSLLLTPLQASLVTALVSAASDLYPLRLPFYFAAALVLSELRRKSSSVIPCIAASCVAAALQLFVILPAS